MVRKQFVTGGFQVLKNIIEDKHLHMLEEVLNSPDFDFRFQAIGLISQVKESVLQKY